MFVLIVGSLLFERAWKRTARGCLRFQQRAPRLSALSLKTWCACVSWELGGCAMRALPVGRGVLEMIPVVGGRERASSISFLALNRQDWDMPTGDWLFHTQQGLTGTLQGLTSNSGSRDSKSGSSQFFLTKLGLRIPCNSRQYARAIQDLVAATGLPAPYISSRRHHRLLDTTPDSRFSLQRAPICSPP
jgi:hypothetical protein